MRSSAVLTLALGLLACSSDPSRDRAPRNEGGSGGSGGTPHHGCVGPAGRCGDAARCFCTLQDCVDDEWVCAEGLTPGCDFGSCSQGGSGGSGGAGGAAFDATLADGTCDGLSGPVA